MQWRRKSIQRQHKIRKSSSLNGAAEGGVYWRTYLLLPLQHNTSSANENFNCDQGVPNGTASGCVYWRASSTQHYTLHPRDRPRLALRAPLQPAQRCKIRNGARPLGTRCFGSAQWPGGPIDACMPYSYLDTSTAVPVCPFRLFLFGGVCSLGRPDSSPSPYGGGRLARGRHVG